MDIINKKRQRKKIVVYKTTKPSNQDSDKAKSPKLLNMTSTRQVWTISNLVVMFIKSKVYVQIFVLDKDDDGWFEGWVIEDKIVSEIFGVNIELTEKLKYILLSSFFINWKIFDQKNVNEII